MPIGSVGIVKKDNLLYKLRDDIRLFIPRIIIGDVVDHFVTFLIAQNENQHHNATVAKTRSFSQANIQLFKENLDVQDF